MSNPCHLSFYLRMCLSVYPYIYLHCIYPYLSIYPSMHVCTCIYLSIGLSIYPCIYTCISIYPYVYLSIHTFTCVCIVSIPVRLSFHAFINLSMDVHCSRGYCWKKMSGITVLHTYIRTYVRTYIHQGFFQGVGARGAFAPPPPPWIWFALPWK